MFSNNSVTIESNTEKKFQHVIAQIEKLNLERGLFSSIQDNERERVRVRERAVEVNERAREGTRVGERARESVCERERVRRLKELLSQCPDIT